MKYLYGVLFSLLILTTMDAQSLKVPTLSPRGEISQEVGLTNVKVSYSRPSAKGRNIFGELVPYGKIWRTGANAATTITFTENVSMGGKAVPAGTYALYAIPDKDLWTVIIHKNTSMRSIEGNYKKEDDLMRFGVMASNSLLYVETFTIEISDIATSSFNIKLSWADIIIKIPVKLNVDNQVAIQMKELSQSADGIHHRDYFKAAEYNFHNDKDLTQAHAYIVNALSKSKESPRYGLLKAKIENKMNKKNMARNTLRLANQWANEQNNTNYINQTLGFAQEMNKS